MAGLVVVGILIIIIPFLPVMHHAHQQMTVGAKLMDGLTEADMLGWIAKAEDFLAQYDDELRKEEAQMVAANPDDKLVELLGSLISIYADQLPADLLDRQIQRVDVILGTSQRPASVSFVWMGGFDHTYLTVDRDPAGGHQIHARYNDFRSKQLWPAMSDASPEDAEGRSGGK